MAAHFHGALPRIPGTERRGLLLVAVSQKSFADVCSVVSPCGICRQSSDAACMNHGRGGDSSLTPWHRCAVEVCLRAPDLGVAAAVPTNAASEGREVSSFAWLRGA